MIPIFFIISITIICILLLYMIKLNKGQETIKLLYEHKFIPLALGKYVNKLK
uniref:Uncharacterized protein n=1 Tax=Cryptophlebia leucotreta granulosis virus TaxID=35254 RepID=A0A2H4ZKJ0_GVCL|nr:hypothetical protein [Cryptophlebia leucotreta granulovirus]